MIAKRKPAPPKPRPKAKQAAGKTAGKRAVAPGASPLNGTVPPPEHRFGPGNQAAVGHGRPRKLADLQELIRDTLAEDLTMIDADGRRVKLTRAQAMVRTMLVKSPSDRIALLEYAFGKVSQMALTMDLSQLNDEQLLRLANGEDPAFVAATASGGDAGTPPAPAPAE